MSDGGEDPGQRALLDIAQQLASTRDLSALVPLVLERVVALLGAERAMFVLLDVDGAVDRAVTHNLPWTGPPAPLPIARSILDRVVREGRMIVASRVDDSAMGSTDSMRRFGLRRVVAVPVLRGSAVLGVIYIDSTASADGAHEQAETLRALASLVGVSVENARLFDELRYRRDLLAWMVHDLRNPITAVSLNAALLLERANGDDRVMLTEVESAAERSARMIDWALTLDRIDDSTPAYAPWSMGLRALLTRSVQEHGSLARQRGVTVTIDVPEGMPEIEVYLDRFSVVLDNLLFNALKFAAAGSAVRVSARRRDDIGPSASPGPTERRGMKVFDRARLAPPAAGAGFVEVSVQNEGPPVSSDVRRRLFSRGAQGLRPNGGTPGGLGLAIAYDCARSLGGMLWIASEAGATLTVFSFTVPART
ncbi:MAG: HAMP domain-containing sensor histidine kinase [Polyangiales bacterium]